MSRRLLLQKGYTRSSQRVIAPFVDIKLMVLNFNTNQQTSFDQKCWIDTGFDGGTCIPQFRESDISMIGVQARESVIRQPGGIQRKAHVCHAFIQQIDNYIFQPPGIDTVLTFYGEEPGYLGLDVLKNWIAEFDGPRQMINIYQ